MEEVLLIFGRSFLQNPEHRLIMKSRKARNDDINVECTYFHFAQKLNQ